MMSFMESEVAKGVIHQSITTMLSIIGEKCLGQYGFFKNDL